MTQLQNKDLYPRITKHYTSYGEAFGTISVDEFIAAIPNTPERELRMLISQLDADPNGYYSLDELFDDVGGVDHVVLASSSSSSSLSAMGSPLPGSRQQPTTPNGDSYKANMMIKVSPPPKFCASNTPALGNFSKMFICQ